VKDDAVSPRAALFPGEQALGRGHLDLADASGVNYFCCINWLIEAANLTAV
jgi:hypothetical protein